MSNERLIAALEEAARLTPYRSWPPVRSFPTSLHSDYRPPEPPEPPTTEIVRTEPSPVAVQRHQEAPGEVRPVWQALLDISAWRSRRWWRLAASLVVKRLDR